GGTWTAYSLDAAAGLLLIPVGNPGPDFNNDARPGTNLFTNSLVALDAKTGELKWWHQLIGPEDRDWDTAVVAAFDPADGSHLAALRARMACSTLWIVPTANFASRPRSFRSTRIAPRRFRRTRISGCARSPRCSGMAPHTVPIPICCT